MRCHSLSVVAMRCHSLSVVVIRCHSLSVVVIRCHSLSVVAIRCHSLSVLCIRRKIGKIHGSANDIGGGHICLRVTVSRTLSVDYVTQTVCLIASQPPRLFLPALSTRGNGTELLHPVTLRRIDLFKKPKTFFHISFFQK